MNIISFDVTKKIKVKNRIYTIKKLNYHESIELSILLSAHSRMHNMHIIFSNKMGFFERLKSAKVIRQKEREIIKYLGIRKVRNNDFNAIIKAMDTWLRETAIDKSKEEKKDDDNFTQWLIAYFAVNLGYSKQEVFNLYPEEISILIDKTENILNGNALKMASAQLAPKEFSEAMDKKKPEMKNQKEGFEYLKMNQKMKLGGNREAMNGN